MICDLCGFVEITLREDIVYGEKAEEASLKRKGARDIGEDFLLIPVKHSSGALNLTRSRLFRRARGGVYEVVGGQVRGMTLMNFSREKYAGAGERT